jgi:hypothetical protein
VGEDVTVENQTFIVWADPGLLTGLAWFDLTTGDFESGQYGPDDLLRKLDRLGEGRAHRMAVGYERFISTSGGSKTSSSEYSHRAIGIIDDFVHAMQVPLRKPQPSSARKLGNVVWLRRLGWYKPGKGHANDAAQHLLSDLLKKQPMPHEIRTKLFPDYTPRGTLAT